MKKRLISLLILPITAQASMFSGSEPAQNKNCSVSDAKQVKECHDGDVLIFTPNYFGNEQLPITVAGLACDFRYPIVYNKGGVSCILTTKRKQSW